MGLDFKNANDGSNIPEKTWRSSRNVEAPFFHFKLLAGNRMEVPLPSNLSYKKDGSKMIIALGTIVNPINI
jgi:hypothetical protein